MSQLCVSSNSLKLKRSKHEPKPFCRGARYTIPGPLFIGAKNKKAIYREYTDATFTKQKQRSKDEEHLGISGPLVKAEVGDTIEIVFKNLASREYSIHPHGILYRYPNREVKHVLAKNEQGR